MFEKLSMNSLTTTMTSGAYRLWDTAKSYFAADSGQDDKDNLQAKTQDNQDDEKVSASLLSTNQQGISWSMPNPKKLLILASLGLAYYTRQAGYDHNYDNQDADISYAINGMDFTFSVPFQTTSNWAFAIPSATGMFAQLAMLYGTTSLLSQSYQYNAVNLFITPLSLMTLSSFLPVLPAQTIETEFFKVFGGNGIDSGNAVKTMPTGDIVVAGSTQGFGAGGYDALVAKLYANGSLAWARTFGGSGDEYSYAVAFTSNNDILVVGQTSSFGFGNYDALIIKLYANGSLAWARAVGGSGDDYAQTIALTPTNDIVIAGGTTSFGIGINDALVAKLYANGSLTWACALGGNGDDYAQALALTSTNDIVITGGTTSFGAVNDDALVAKLYVSGNLAWARALGGNRTDKAFALALMPNNDEIIITGFTVNGVSDAGALLAKLYTNGSLAWVRILGGSGDNIGHSLVLTSNNDIVMIGSTNSFGAGNNDALIAKLDNDGSLDWTRTLGGSNNDYGQAFFLTSNDDIVVTGYTDSFGAENSDVLLVKLNANGTIPGCNLTRTVQPTFLNWTNITNKIINPTVTSLNITEIIQDWTNINVQFIAPQSSSLCFAQRNGSMNTLSSSVIPTSVVPSGSNSLTSNISPSSSQGSANSLTETSSSVFSVSTSSILTSVISASDVNASVSSTSVDATTSNNPTSVSTSPSASQSSSAYSFSVSVSTTPITIEQGISTTLTSNMLSISGNVPPSQVIYTIIGNNSDIIITVNGLEVTQFTQEDVEGNFVAIAIPGVTCGDDYSTDLQLEANVAGSNAPAQQASVSLVLDITTCSYAGRLSLFSYRDTHIGFWANSNPKERQERETKLIQSTTDNLANIIRFRQ